MLYIRKQNGIGSEEHRSGKKGCRRASAVILAAVTALSPLSAQGMMKQISYTELAAAADSDTSAPAKAPQTAESSTDASAASSAAESAATAATAAEAASDATTSGAETAAETSTSGAETAAEAAAEASTSGAETAAAEAPGIDEGRAVRVHLAGVPGDPVPSKVMDTDTASLLKMISEGLVVLDENNNPVPGCAKSWEVSEDGLQWTFHLRDDLKWSDGFSMEAEDFVSMFVKTADPMSEVLYGQDLTQNIAGYEEVLNGDSSALQVIAQDEKTIVVHLLTPDPDFARICASWALLPVRERILDDFDEAAPADWNSVTGNGPYYIESVTAREEYILKKNPYYVQNEASPGTPFDTVHWLVSGDINEEYSDFLNGGIDAVSAIPEEEERLLEEENLIQRKNFPDTMGICFNCRHEVLADARVRRALSLAVDRSFIASTILQDVYQPEGGDGQNDQGDIEDHIPEAQELLEEAGYKDGEGFPVLTCIADESGGALLTAEYLASAWKDLGIEVRVEAVEADDLAQEKTAGTFDIYCGSIFLTSDIPAVELAAFTTENENNISGFSSEEYDLLIAQASEISDEEEYAETLEKAFDILREEVPAVPLVTRCVSWLRQDDCTGIICDSTGCWQVWDTESADLAADQAAGAEGTESAGLPDAAAAAADAEDTEDGESAVDTAAADPDNSEDGESASDMAAADAENTEDGESAVGTAAADTETVGNDRSAADAESSTDDASDANKKTVTVTACIPEAGGSSGQENVTRSLPTITSAAQSDDAETEERAAVSEYFSNSETYFEKADCNAYLIRQAWIYDGVGEDAERLVSLPKYTEIHLTGTGNRRFVRISEDGTFHYLESAKVSMRSEDVDDVRAREEAGLAQKELLTASMHSAKESQLEDRAADVRARTDEILAAIAHREMLRTQTRNPNWDGPVLSRGRGSVMGPSGKETYYNLNMSGVVSIMRRMGNTDEYWVRDDGCKMLGDYIMCAANLRVHPRGSLVECSLGTCIVCDTGGFASHNSHQLDIAVTW